MTRTLAVVALLVVALAPAGCGAKSTPLPYAVYANEVPIFAGAVFEDASGSTSLGDTPESGADGMAWFFKVRAPASKMVEFYEKRFPEAKRDPDWTDGVRLVWTPKGAKPGEELSVVIADNQFSIREEVRIGTRPGDPNKDSREMAESMSGALSGGGSDDPE
ncbi:MAG TPA: hypothetical protein VJY35_09925 [Candidatus Eisenbacteria bacterium]|nr:hypothetical protein [Candidatus Eisenbacteria bacterium]